ncbi:MAG: hypothetical protein C7B46_19980 [Sulfobacillus benefaciens]|uniref:Uncharacterized protein n=1 Tax=Sulfobacillus benefaciens TaxID=453960 RepID=A0A2T2WVZ4_9FIRM|nr:MAG: hypothetical protein C7B46_19980 [Sulfobacillus benefaciens]
MDTIQDLPGMVRVIKQLRRVIRQGEPITVTADGFWQVRTADFLYAIPFPPVIPPGVYWDLPSLLPLFDRGIGTVEREQDLTLINGVPFKDVAGFPEAIPDVTAAGWTLVGAISPGEWDRLRYGLAKDEHRPILQRVGIEPGHAVATDGTMIIAVYGIGRADGPRLNLPWVPLTGDALLWTHANQWVISAPDLWVWGKSDADRYPDTTRIWPTQAPDYQGTLGVQATLAQWTAMARVGWKDLGKKEYATLSGYIRVSDGGWAKATDWLPDTVPATAAIQRIAWNPDYVVRALKACPNPRGEAHWQVFAPDAQETSEPWGGLLQISQGETRIVVLSYRGLVSIPAMTQTQEDDHANSSAM